MELVYHDISRIDEVKSFIQAWEDGSDYISCNTSGSTGTPKLIQLSKKQLAHSAMRTIDYFGLKAGMKAGLALSTDGIAGKLMVIRSMLAHLELHVLPVKKNPLEAVETSLDFIALVPTQAIAFLNDSKNRQKETTVLIGGAPLTSPQHQAIFSYWKHAYQSYGMTETASHVALRRITDEENAPYHAMNGISFNEENSHLVIYCRDFNKAGVHTTDCVELLSPDSFRYIGRKDFVINVAGNKVHPEELERKLNSHIAGEFMIIPFPDETYGQGIGLVLTQEGNTLSLEVFKAIEGLNAYEIPRKQTILDRLERNINDKLDRKSMIEAGKTYVWQPIL